MHKNEIFYALICINNHLLSCLISMLSLLQRYGMQDCKPLDTPIAKGEKLSLNQCPRNILEIPEMEKFLYTQVVMSLMYAQVCSRPVIAYIMEGFGLIHE